ncbi:oxidoreductase [Thalassobacillus devorans]|uniref:Oxidoreductase n=1 Tax=Thalassobacillus devorans TaxID=279813 RepID=A0ABQ1PUA9_9BACI|nr:NADP-dependent oxidoreductase [Thalassobacillus devorans]NIK29520.1 NADPH:quinone reductase-like Zn-dependent oxidoreductase [Thalassobacillus devorans]GGD04044.1 oxidoreductase [Thalassobacillus devorans]
MRAVVIDNYGDKEQLKMREIDKPEITDDQVLVELHAASINPIDWKLRQGYLKEKADFDFPIILGWDLAGVVAETGKNVTKFKKGDNVFARPDLTRLGTYAEYAAVDERLLAHMPENITYEEAASVPLAGLTAWQCLIDFSEIKDGDKVLIHAGSGGVGSYAIQLAKHFGAYVATTASGKNQDWVTELGVDRFINYQEEDFSEVLEGFDIVVDTIGGEVQEKSYEVLKDGGKLVSIVQPPEEEKAKELGIKAGFHWLEPEGEQLAKIADLIKKGKVRAVVGHQFDFSEEGLKQAHELSETHHAQGKIAISIK